MIEIADTSEFQGVIHFQHELGAVILRGHNGLRADRDFAANRANAQAAVLKAIGIYQYLVASRDAAEQARELVAVIGRLAPNEFVVCDLEEGGGDEQERWQAWRAVIVAAFGRAPWLYSGDAFAETHDLQPDWVAAYQAREPGTPWRHRLWQDTDSYPWPWGRSDASVFDGTLPEFLAAVGITNTTPPAGAGTNPLEVLAMDPVKYAGFVVRSIYRSALHREVDPGSYTADVAFLRDGGDPDVLLARIQDSPEGQKVIAAERKLLGL